LGLLSTLGALLSIISCCVPAMYACLQSLLRSRRSPSNRAVIYPNRALRNRTARGLFGSTVLLDSRPWSAYQPTRNESHVLSSRASEPSSSHRPYAVSYEEPDSQRGEDSIPAEYENEMPVVVAHVICDENKDHSCHGTVVTAPRDVRRVLYLSSSYLAKNQLSYTL